MRMSLLTKFFLSFLAAGVVLVGILISTMQFYAFKNFSDYVTQSEYQQLDTLVPILTSEYRTNKNDWSFLRHNHSKWVSIFEEAGLVFPPKPSRLPQGLNQAFLNPPKSPLIAGHHRPPRPRPGDLGPRILLFDKNKQLVMGSTSKVPNLLKPIPETGPPIGYLGFEKAPKLSHPLDIQFLKQQKKGVFIAGACFLLCSVLISFLMARHLLSPIRKLSKATQALSRRQFNTRIQVRSGDELGVLAQDFNHLTATLEAYEIRQNNWLSDISHELRTPLSILQGELEAIQDGVRKVDKTTVNTLHSQVTHLIRLVSDLHDLSIAEANEIAMNKTLQNIPALLASTLDQFTDRFKKRKIQISTDIGSNIEIFADKDRLLQVFINILENSLVYTQSPGKIKITTKRDKKSVLILFEDSAPGVSAQVQPRLFDRLFRADKSRNRKMGGSGLGLSICKHIVEAHQGKIHAKDSSLGGLGIEIILPATG